MTQTIQANGITMRYSIDGPENAPVVTMSHSLSANLTMWDPQVSALAERYRVLRYDTRGHGGSDVPAGEYDFGQLADDAVALLDGLGIERTHFVGLSMGGMIGQHLGLKHGARLLSLTLADTSSGYPPEAAAGWGDRIAFAKANGMAATVDATIERWFSPAFVASGAPVVEKVRDMIRQTPVQGYCGCGAAIRALDTTPHLAKIRVPTLVIVGEDDPGTPVSMAKIIADGIPGAELVILPVVRHLSNLEDVSGFNAALTGFLARH